MRLEACIGHAIDRETADELFRNFHTIKGLSGMVGLREAEILAHHMESYLDALRRNRASLSPAAIDALAAGASLVETCVAARCAGQRPLDPSKLVARLSALVHTTASDPSAEGLPPAFEEMSPGGSEPSVECSADSAAVSSGEGSWLFTFIPSALLAERGVNVNTIRERLLSRGKLRSAAPKVLPSGQIEFTFVVSGNYDSQTLDAWREDGLLAAPYAASPAIDPDDFAPAAESANDAPAAPVAPAASASSPAAAPSLTAVAGAIRVDLTKLDSVMRMVSELVISRARFEEHLKQIKPYLPAEQWRLLQEDNLAFSRQIRDLREGVVRVRLAPVHECFARMQFVARDSCANMARKFGSGSKGKTPKSTNSWSSA